MSDIWAFRRMVERLLILFLWINGVVVGVVGFSLSADGAAILSGALLLAAAATLIAWLQPGAAATRHCIGVALMGMVALLVFALEEHPWQIDMHMYFFAGLAMLTAFCDWRTLIVAAAAVAVHHLLLNFVYPAAVFPGASFGRVLFHAAIVVIEVGVLAWLSWRLSLTFSQNAEALESMDNARAATETAALDREKSSEAERVKRHALRADLAQGFQDRVGSIVSSLSDAARTTRQLAVEVDRQLGDVGARLSSVRDRTGTVVMDVNQVAGSADELLIAVGEVNRFIGESTALASEAVAEVERTNATVETLAAAAHKIGDVVNLIQDIASQTNLLALNATIEAARAGEAGKGFAVVAGEVKHLASQTARATGEIGQQISEIQAVTEGAVDAIRAIGATIGRIEQAISTIAHSSERQTAGITSISRTARAAASVVDSVNGDIRQMGSVTEHLATMSSRQTEQASSMASEVEILGEQVEGFVGEVRRG